jgi:hypothetical protein
MVQVPVNNGGRGLAERAGGLFRTPGQTGDVMALVEQGVDEVGTDESRGAVTKTLTTGGRTS